MTKNFKPDSTTTLYLSIGNLDIDDLNAKMSKLSEKSVSLKVELMENIQRKHGDFLPALDAAIFLERKVEDLKMDMEILSTNIESQVRFKEYN